MPKKAKMMRATRELVYNTRRMLPGTLFEVDGRYVIRLLATRKAELVREPAVVPPPPPAVAAKIAAAVEPRPPAPPPAIAAGVTGNVASGEGGAPPTTVGAMTTTSQPALVPGGASGVGQHVQPTPPRARAKGKDESGS